MVMLAFILLFCLCGWCCNRFFYIRDQWLQDLVNKHQAWKKKRKNKGEAKYRINDFDNPMGNIYDKADDDEQLVASNGTNQIGDIEQKLTAKPKVGNFASVIGTQIPNPIGPV